MDNTVFDFAPTRNLSGIGAAAYQDRRVRDMLRAVSCWRWLVIALAIVAGGVAAAVLSFGGTSYRAEAIVHIDFNQREFGMAGQAHTSGVAVEASAVVQSEAKIMRSDEVARRVVERLGLADELRPPKLLVLADRVLAWLGSPADALRQSVSGDADDPVETAMRLLASKLTIQTENRSYLITILYSADRPEKSVRVVNAVAQEYLNLRSQSLTRDTLRVADGVTAHLRSKAEELLTADAAVAEYRARSGFLEEDARGESIDVQVLRNLMTQLSASTVTRINAEERLERVRQLRTDGGAPLPSDLQPEPLQQARAEHEAARREIIELRTRFGASHPAVRAAEARLAEANSSLDRAAERMIKAAQANADSARRAEIDLKQRVAALQNSIISVRKPQEAQLRNLEANVKAIRDEIALMTRVRDQALTRGLQGGVASLVVAAPRPMTSPASRATPVIALAAIGGLLAGMALAIALEARDLGFRTSGDVPLHAQVRCFGMVPELRSRRLSRFRRAPRGQRLAAVTFNEASRMVGVAAGLFSMSTNCQVVLVTSSLSGEGRSTLCRALGRALAAAGKRVLVVDSAPQPERAVSKPVEPAVISYKHGELGDFCFLTLERRAGDAGPATKVLGPSDLTQAISEFRSNFDVILLEGPPVLLVSDSLVLSQFASKVIHVARWARTKQHEVRAALQRLHEAGAPVSGLVITRVDLARHARMGFVDECTRFLKEARFYQAMCGARTAIFKLQ